MQLAHGSMLRERYPRIICEHTNELVDRESIQFVESVHVPKRSNGPTVSARVIVESLQGQGVGSLHIQPTVHGSSSLCGAD